LSLNSRRPPEGDISQSQLSDDEDYTQFVSVWYRSLLHSAWLLTGNSHTAEDLLQTVLVKVYVVWPRVRSQEPLAYVRRMLVNARTDRWRALRRERLVDTPPIRSVDETGHTAVDNRDALVRALQTLTARERQVIILRYYFDLPQEQVAADLGLNVGTVKSTASRALAQLRVSGPLHSVVNTEGSP
jgi:RNA polymerase sigma-70 factor (sigma-E family)